MRLAASVTCVMISVASSPAFAQAPAEPAGPPVDAEAQQTAIARTAFEEGLALADQQRWAEAAARFSQASSVRTSAPIRYNLAGSLAHLGRLIEAAELLRSVEADEEAEDGVVRAARQLRARVENRLASVVIHVPEEHGATGVILDDLALPPEVSGLRFPVDPGAHAVVLERDGSEIDRAAVVLSEQEAAEIRFAPPASAAATGGRLLSQAWFWGAVGMVVVGATLATVIVVTADDGSAGAGGALVAF